ncbi:hypothetical protein OO007_17030 [Cocleimonas sp. KMM 6892]|nr:MULTISPECIES: hypothetical protein [unclassified Cocleimonas]MEB8433945.1 hypothetical protein [Cocleimonas sp. KMM 6892]MEC4716756.1 hypothetical protein [Cocleimonas sp. KMM 6895]MEC4746089.1 hypothetical protein [Cocleimonas sp. KMM 6896]
MKITLNIPMVTNLVVAGDPRLKAKAVAAKKKSMRSSTLHIDELNQRIDELETAIGQDKSGPIGRAFAIRAETNRKPKSKRKVNTE